MTDEQTGLPAATSAEDESTDEPETDGCDPIIVAESWELPDDGARVLEDDDYIDDPQWSN